MPNIEELEAEVAALARQLAELCVSAQRRADKLREDLDLLERRVHGFQDASEADLPS